MESITQGSCLAWEPAGEACTDFPDEPTPEQQALIDFALEAATEALWVRTKRQFGTCLWTYRPCHTRCEIGWPWIVAGNWRNASGWVWPFPALLGGTWVNLACGLCGDGCSCDHIEQVRLPQPVAQVTEVKLDGEVLDPAAYRVDNEHLLVRVDGGRWPRCNDLGASDDEPGTWSVTALYGREVPMLGRLAVGELASEIYKSCAGAGGCKIPRGVVKRVTRQGVTKEFFDADVAFTNNRVGLYYTDLFVSSFNPTGSSPAAIFDIDGGRRRWTTPTRS